MFWEVLGQVAEPVSKLMSEEEAKYKRTDCLFPAAGSRAPRVMPPKFRPKRRKIIKSSLLRSTARFLSSKPARKFEPNPWIDESSSNGSSGPKKVIQKCEKVEQKCKAKKRRFNEAFLKEGDKNV